MGNCPGRWCVRSTMASWCQSRWQWPKPLRIILSTRVTKGCATKTSVNASPNCSRTWEMLDESTSSRLAVLRSVVGICGIRKGDLRQVSGDGLDKKALAIWLSFWRLLVLVAGLPTKAQPMSIAIRLLAGRSPVSAVRISSAPDRASWKQPLNLVS